MFEALKGPEGPRETEVEDVREKQAYRRGDPGGGSQGGPPTGPGGWYPSGGPTKNAGQAGSRPPLRGGGLKIDEMFATVPAPHPAARSTPPLIVSQDY